MVLSIGIVGSGPSAFYTAQRILKKRSGVQICFYEKLTDPFGLVRFGVAPDHEEIKRCKHKFREILKDSRVNIQCGREIMHIKELLPIQHDALVVCIGTEEEKRLGIEGEETCLTGKFGVFGSRSVVGWYNGHPLINPQYHEPIHEALRKSKHVAIVGNGNVALDVARMLTKGQLLLQKYHVPTISSLSDLADNARQTLSNTKLDRISILGRRGPLQSSFSTRELREFINLPQIQIQPSTQIQNLIKFNLNHPVLSMDKHSVRMLNIWNNMSLIKSTSDADSCRVDFQFLVKPAAIELDLMANNQIKSLILEHMYLQNELAQVQSEIPSLSTGIFSELQCDMVITCIGYSLKKGILGGLEVENGKINNNSGRIKKGLYVSGWCKTGPKGVLASTLADAYETADSLLHDFQNNN